jgi:hypothetical protein
MGGADQGQRHQRRLTRSRVGERLGEHTSDLFFEFNAAVSGNFKLYFHWGICPRTLSS